ncbi:MAG: zinc-ribbon domain-containing protein [Candidatus Woesearchaeota archaeon]
MAYCPECGTKVQSHHKFCQDCGAKIDSKHKPEHKVESHKKPSDNHKQVIIGILTSVILVSMIAIFFLYPIPYQRVEFTTKTSQYQTQESYQETVNSDNCDNAPSCVCSQRGGFLWLTCVQCSCTRTRNVVANKLVLDQVTITDQCSLFDMARGVRVSKTHAQDIVTRFLSVLTSIRTPNSPVTIGDTNLENGVWKVQIFEGGSTFESINVNAQNGDIVSVTVGGVTAPIENLIATYS